MYGLIDDIQKYRKEIEALGSENERQRQVIARLSAPGIERAPWFYAPCSKCGAIQGMGLATPRVDGKLLRDHTSVWCANCEHFGPPVATNRSDVKESDRAAAMAWNREFAIVFAGLKKETGRLRAALDLIRRGYANPEGIASDALEPRS